MSNHTLRLVVIFVTVFLSTHVNANEVVCKQPVREANREIVQCVVSGPTPIVFIQREAGISNDQYDGPMITYYPPSENNEKQRVYQEFNFVNGKRNGLSKMFTPDGVLREQIPYVNDMPQGEALMFYPDGKVMAKTVFDQNQIVKIEQWFDQNGKPRDGEYTDQDPLSGIKRKVTFVNGYKNGEEITYLESADKPQTIITYQDGKRNGLAKMFAFKNDSWVLVETMMFVNDRRNGLYQKLVDGKISQEIMFVNDVMEGPDKFYSSEGYLLSVTEKKNNISNGKREIYYPNGNLKFVDYYVNGEREGEFISYDENGNVIKKEMYRAGKLVE